MSMEQQWRSNQRLFDIQHSSLNPIDVAYLTIDVVRNYTYRPMKPVSQKKTKGLLRFKKRPFSMYTVGTIKTVFIQKACYKIFSAFIYKVKKKRKGLYMYRI